MKEQILNVLATLGFQLEEMEGFGYGFQYEGINYLFMPNEDDEEFLNISVPAILEINDDNIHAALMLMDKMNSTLKYVKTSLVMACGCSMSASCLAVRIWRNWCHE